MSLRLVVVTRQLTGAPLLHRGYVLDRASGDLTPCGHSHRRRGLVSGSVYARRCGERVMRRIEKEAPHA